MPIYLHVVVEYADPVFAEMVTAYVPDELQWESPSFKRRKQQVRSYDISNQSYMR